MNDKLKDISSDLCPVSLLLDVSFDTFEQAVSFSSLLSEFLNSHSKYLYCIDFRVPYEKIN